MLMPSDQCQHLSQLARLTASSAFQPLALGANGSRHADSGSLCLVGGHVTCARRVQVDGVPCRITWLVPEGCKCTVYLAGSCGLCQKGASGLCTLPGHVACALRGVMWLVPEGCKWAVYLAGSRGLCLEGGHVGCARRVQVDGVACRVTWLVP